MQAADILSKIINRDKSWVFTYDLEMKHHSCEWQANTLPQKNSCGPQNLSEGHVDSFSMTWVLCTMNLPLQEKQ
jgi:hypothetical protein